MRTLVIGDIHGCNQQLRQLLFQINLKPNDILVTLGDYIDRGPDSYGVIETLIDISKHCTLIPLRGNHEELLLNSDKEKYQIIWCNNGAAATLSSYSTNNQQFVHYKSVMDLIPDNHIEFLKNCKLYYEDDNNIFCHAGYNPNLDLKDNSKQTLLWDHVKSNNLLQPHKSGKTAWLGHTPQKGGLIVDHGHLKMIDVGSSRTGRLAAVDTATGQIWYAC